MPAGGGDREILTVAAHGASYRMYASSGLGAGVADSKVTRCMRRGRPYEAALLEHIWSLRLPAGTVAVDAGANVGNHTLWMAAICGLRVHAFEPIVTDQLAANVALNRGSVAVTVWDRALGAGRAVAQHAGKGRLRVDPGRVGAVPVIPLDEVALADVAVMKLDVEGMESDVLAGAVDTIDRSHPIIFAEEWADDPRWHRRIAGVLEPHGYEMVRLFSGRESPTPVGKWVWLP